MSEKEALTPTNRLSATNTPSKARNCAVPAKNLRSEISSRVFATLETHEAIKIKCALCSYFDKNVYSF